MRSLLATLVLPRNRLGLRPRRWCRVGMLTVAVCLVGTGSTIATAQATTRGPAAAATTAAASATAMPSIVPKPVRMTPESGRFTLTASTKVVVAAGSPAALPVARDLAGYLRPATGYLLPVASGPRDGNIAIILGNPGTLSGDRSGEGYQLDVSAGGVTLEAPTPHGLYNGVQTIRQLLPAWIASGTIRPGPWTMPAVRITDFPRYSYRGLMVDIARHFETPSAIEQVINQAAAYKINVLHLHLSDDQGFRIVINGFPNLTSIGSQGSVGTDGRTMDPGGYWTQAQYMAVVRDAAAHFITVVPEVDTPGHNNAIIMSEYNDTANPLLNGHPQDINCGANNPPVWDYTGDVGYSALCPDSQNTWTILSTIIKQLTAMSPGPYYDIGGDEVPSSLLSQQQYAALVNKEAGVVTADGKTVMGWADIAGPGTDLTGSAAEYWQPASGSAPGTETATEAVAKGMKLIMAPANRTYLDQKYLAGSAGNVPPTLGLSWACQTGCDVDAAYNWDPGNRVTGVTDKNVMGVEGAIWGETVTNLSNVDYMVFPRLLAVAEVAWSPDADRGATSPAYGDFLTRLAAQGGRLMAAQVNFYPSAEVPWTLELAPAAVRASAQGQVSGTVATLAAPGIASGNVTVTINWGDGTTTAGSATGTAATATTVNGLYMLGGTHSYPSPGVYHATVTATAPGKTAATTDVTVVYQPHNSGGGASS